MLNLHSIILYATIAIPGGKDREEKGKDREREEREKEREKERETD